MDSLCYRIQSFDSDNQIGGGSETETLVFDEINGVFRTIINNWPSAYSSVNWFAYVYLFLKSLFYYIYNTVSLSASLIF